MNKVFEFIEEENDDWLEKIKKNDELYNDFYSEEPSSIKINYLYINQSNELVNIKQENILLTNKKVSKDNLLFLLKKHSNHSNKKYSISSMLKYNIDIFPEDIYSFLKDPKKFDFIQEFTKIQDLTWRNTINLFQDMNSLYIFYNEKKKPTGDKTRKRIYIRKDIRKDIRKNKTRKY